MGREKLSVLPSREKHFSRLSKWRLRAIYRAHLQKLLKKASIFCPETSVNTSLKVTDP